MRSTRTEQYISYLNALRRPFKKMCRLRFLNSDGSTAFSIDNNTHNKRSSAFIQDGTLTVNLQNGQRRQANVTLSNLDGAYDYNINSLWFGQEVAIDEGLVLPDGTEYYIPQGVFLIETPTENYSPGVRTAQLSLIDKWANLDGTLFGNLEGTYQVPVGTNIFSAIQGILNLDRGNGIALDSVSPIFTEYYNGKTQLLPNGRTANLTDTPYTLKVDSDSGTYADVIRGLSDMINAWIGYDKTGALRVDPSQDDILDTDKPVLWRFSPNEVDFLGATYTVKNTDVYNDVIVIGESLSDYTQAAGRATNLDPSSDTNIYTSLGKRTIRLSSSGYYTKQQCEDLAVWKLKRMSVLQKSVSISCGQLFHIEENNLVEIQRTDRPGAPVERHLVMGFSRPLSQTGAMTISAVSVNDFATATVTSWPQ